MSRSPALRLSRATDASASRADASASAADGDAASDAGRRLTVLQVVPTLDSGAADSGALDAVRCLMRAGHRAVVVSHGGRREIDVTVAGGELRLMNVASANPLVVLGNALRLARLVRGARCDIVHAHGRAAAWSAYLAARLTHVPLVTSWYKGFREQNVFKRLYNGVMARGDRVIAVGDQIAELISDRHHAARDRVVVVPASVDVEAFDPERVAPAEIEAVRRAWGVKPGARVVLVLGRMLRRKGHHVVINAIARLKARGLKDFVCVFIGEDNGRSRYVGELWDLVMATETTDVVRLPAPVHDLRAAYAAASVAVSAALQPEGVQRSALEVQAMQIPLVVSDLAAGPDVVLSPPHVPEDRMTGLRVPAGDDAALAAALLRMFSYPEPVRRLIGARGRAWVAAHFDAGAAGAQVLALYTTLARADGASHK